MTAWGTPNRGDLREFGAACRHSSASVASHRRRDVRLLDLLLAGGARFAYHGDFDWAVSGSQRRYGAGSTGSRGATSPRLRSAVAVDRWPGSSTGLGGEPADTPWDPELVLAMRQHDVRIEEELVLDALLRDLHAGS